MAASNPSSPRIAEVELIGSRSVEAATPAVASPEIKAAFLAFHRDHITAGDRLAPARKLLGSGSWAFVALAAVGLGGGLFLASMPYGASSEPASVASARPPEMIYLPPTTDVDPRSAANAAAEEPSATRAETTVARTDLHAPVPHEDQHPDNPSGDPALASTDPWNIALSSDQGFRAATANFDVAMRYSAAGYVLGSTPGDGTDAGYGAIELPSVPEPSAGAIVCLSLATLIGVTHLRKRRS